MEEINFSKEYHEARKMLGTKGADLDKLLKSVCYVYVHTPEEWQFPYYVLIKEIGMRQLYTDTGIFVNTFNLAS